MTDDSDLRAHSSSRGAGVARVFVLGAPRSGTSWVQRLAAEQDCVVTVPELHLFSRYMRPMFEAWRKESAHNDQIEAAIRDGAPLLGRAIGLSACIEPDDFVSAVRSFCDSVTDQMLSSTPGARLFVEKTPSNSLLVRIIGKVYPEASYVHVIRDPRNVVRSLRDAATGWGKGWAPRSVTIGALTWRAHVIGAWSAKEIEGADYIEFRYEELRSDESVRIVLRAFIAGLIQGSAATDGATSEAKVLLSPKLAALAQNGVLRDPAEFGDGTQERPPLSTVQRLIVEVICGDLMDSLGYARSRWTVLPTRAFVKAVRMAGRSVSAPRAEGLMLALNRFRPGSLLFWR